MNLRSWRDKLNAVMTKARSPSKNSLKLLAVDAQPLPPAGSSTSEEERPEQLQTAPQISTTPGTRPLQGLDSLIRLIEARKSTSGKSFDDAVEKFKQLNGEIEEAYFTRGLAAGVVLVHKKPKRLRPSLGSLDKAQRQIRRILLVRIDGRDLALQAPLFDEVLWRTIWTARQTEHRSSILLVPEARRVVASSLYTIAVFLLGALDSVSDRGTKERLTEDDVELLQKSAKAAKSELNKLDAYISKTGIRTAIRTYLYGLPLGALLVGTVVMIAARYYDESEARTILTLSVIAGALGSITSVMIRITRGQKLEVQIEEGRFITILAGAFRPLVGAIFGVALYVLVQAEFLPLDDEVDLDGTEAGVGQPLIGGKFFFYAGLAFLAGFSERWAQDTILQSRPVVPSPATTRTDPLGGDDATDRA